MSRMQRMMLMGFAFWCVFALFCGSAQAQYTWEYTPRLGEQRFNRFVYKASHNSYERNESLWEQIDKYNCWNIELDIWWWDPATQGPSIRVSHTSPTDFHPTLEEKLSEMARSATKHDRVTVLQLEMKTGGVAAVQWPDQATYRARIVTAINNAFGADRIYTFTMFNDTTGDNGRWPSYQELVRRGKNFIIVLEEPDRNNNSTYFFTTHFTSEMDGSAFSPPYKIVYNSGNSSASFGNLGDRFLARCYPNPDSGEDYWNAGAARGYSFLSTNKIDHAYTMNDMRTHSPAPLFVRLGSAPSTQYGTYGLPFYGANGLLNAINRASPMVDVRISTGTYDVPDGTIITRPVILKAPEGSVDIR